MCCILRKFFVSSCGRVVSAAKLLKENKFKSFMPVLIPANSSVNDKRFNATNNGEKERYIQNIWANHQEVIRLASMGMKHTAIAAEVGLTPVQIGNILNSPLARAEVLRLSNLRDGDAAQISARIRKQVEQALALTEQILDGCVVDKDGEVQIPSLSLMQRTASDILDRDPASQKRSTQTKERSGALTTADIAEIVSAAREMGIQMQEAEVVETNQPEGRPVSSDLASISSEHV